MKIFGRKVGGGAEGNRTPDLYNAIVALYQLSYDPEILKIKGIYGFSKQKMMFTIFYWSAAYLINILVHNQSEILIDHEAVLLLQYASQ